MVDNPSKSPRPHVQYDMVLDALPEAVLTIDRDFVVTSFNQTAERLSGRRRGDAIGHYCHDVLHHVLCDNVARCPMTELLTTGRAPAVREVRLAGRRDALARLSLHALRNASGEIVGGLEMVVLPANEEPAAGAAPAAREERKEARLRPLAAGLTVLDAAERRTIEDVLRRHKWNRSHACQELGVSRITLWRKMRKLGISRR